MANRRRGREKPSGRPQAEVSRDPKCPCGVGVRVEDTLESMEAGLGPHH